MRALFILLSALLLAVALGWILQQTPGGVVFTYKEWIIQTSLVVFVIAAIVLFLLVYALIRTLARLWRAPTDLRRWSENRRRGRVSAEQARTEQLALHAGLLRQAGRGQDGPALEDAWRRVPNRLKKESALLGAYVTGRLRLGDSSGCEAMLRRALKKQWDPELARLFGLVEGRNLKRQLAFAENSLSRFPRDAALLLTLGRLCKKLQLWGRARSYLEQSNEAQPNPEACQELATLLEQQGDPAAAARYYQEGLNIVTALPATAGSAMPQTFIQTTNSISSQGSSDARKLTTLAVRD